MSARGPASGLGARAAIQLVARREVAERLRARSFRVATAITLLLVAAAIVVPSLISDKPPTYHVAFVGPPSALLSAAVGAVGQSVGATVVVDAPTTRGDATARVLDGHLDLVVTDVDIVVKETLPPGDLSKRARFSQAVASVVALQRGLADAGLPPDAVQRALSSGSLPVRGLEKPKPDRSAERATATVGLLLTFAFLSLFGSWIVIGVVEEKASRVVEVLLATMQARHLLVGKVVGIGLVALAQAALVVITALAAATATGSDVLHGAGGIVLVQTFAWFLLGYGTYAFLFAAGGSLVSRSEEAQNVVFPLTIPLYASYILAITALSSNDSSTLVRVMSWIPFTAPLAMPVRYALGDADVVEIVGSMLVTTVAIAALSQLAGTVYERNVLRTGGRVRWREALRGPRDAEIRAEPARP
jgi:ABC-2 type transport system permease protein